MTRFSLDSLRVPPVAPYRESNDDDDDDSSNCNSLSSASSDTSSLHNNYNYHNGNENDNFLFGIDVDVDVDTEAEVEEEKEEAHPLGFGTTRFGLYDDHDNDNDYNGDNDDDYFDDMEDLNAFFHAPLIRKMTRNRSIASNAQESAILMRHHYKRRHCDHRALASASESKYGYDNDRENHNDNDALSLGPLVNRMDRIAALVRAASILPPPADSTTANNNNSNYSYSSQSFANSDSTKFQQLLNAAKEQRQAEHEAKLKMKHYSDKLFAKQKADAELLLSLIQRETHMAQCILDEERREEEQVEEAQRLVQEREDEEERLKVEERDRVEGARLAVLEQEREASIQQEAKARKQLEVQVERKKKQESELAKKTEYVKRAKKKVEKLDIVRASLEVFETSKEKAISRRRLQMKKVARGKMNTLSNEKSKVEMVTNQVVEALRGAYQEDVGLKQQMQSGNTAITREMTRGMRYLMDLIASSVVVRVQAEGFNGCV